MPIGLTQILFSGIVLVICASPALLAAEDPAAVGPNGLVPGGAFIDLIRPIPVHEPLEANVWGGDNVKPREAHNGIEDAKWSYWGASVIHGSDGKEHLFGARWLETSAQGHMAWPSSRAYHAVADLPSGPFVVREELGPGHNTVIYQAKDGSFVVSVIGKCYFARSLDGPWTRSQLKFDSRGMRPVHMSNLTFTKREDGSILMVSRTGQVWISEDGLKPFIRITSAGIYPKIKDAEYLEDPVVWRDEVQYNLIVNNWSGRRAYYARSRDGIHWKWEQGSAYDPNVVRHPDGTIEGWYKLERPQVRQDDLGRATHLYLAAIDCPKDQDKGGDNHSSKSVALPLTVPRRLTILNDELTPGMNKIRVEIKAEAGFDPQKDVNVSSLAFGSPEAVNFGHGTKPLESEDAGKDLIVTFDGSDQWRKDDFAAKLLGNTTQGELLFGYAKLPGERELEPILLPRTPQLNRGTDGNVSISVLVENFGQVQSATTSMKVVFAGENTKHTFTTSIPVIAPYGHSSVSIPLASISVNPRTNYSIEFIINPDLRNAEHFQTNEVKLP